MSNSATPWTAAHQVPLSMGFSRQEYWSRLPCPPPGDLPNPGMEPTSPESPALQVDSLPLCHQGSLSFYGYILFLFFRFKKMFLSLGFPWFLRETVSWHEWSGFTGPTICLVIYNLYFILFNFIVWGGIFLVLFYHRGTGADKSPMICLLHYLLCAF